MLVGAKMRCTVCPGLINQPRGEGRKGLSLAGSRVCGVSGDWKGSKCIGNGCRHRDCWFS